ncbi:MAG: AAA family ATPase [Leptolyngbya sp. UWPOB_LEPTO1]|uniref:AAA family ATPase n=1 Tax=Leptolyngbya sp. UWPOB_LEPTO1 TaxID=2815653 RepID=UPI001AC304E6|nr:AAA family ATPase [Leptolyngbya sp. UWPOB_LEPTO1]MBN8562904.1 AAA family ATPase [Leptolyngbya sp. UWPOB_LEPTO1]
MIGLPGSGKSTLADSLLADESLPSELLCSREWNFQDTHTRRLISTDAIRAQLFGDEAIQGSWLKIWLEVRSQFQQAGSAIAADELEFAIYDATNAVRKQRRAAIALARKAGFTHITGIWVNPTIEICLERNRLRSRQVPEEVIHRMARRLYGAPPSVEEGLDCLIETESQTTPHPLLPTFSDPESNFPSHNEQSVNSPHAT